jgi:cytochrome c5
MHFKNSITAIFAIFVIIFAAKTFFSSLIYVGYDDNLSLAERIQPVGQVYLSGDVAVSIIHTPTKKFAKNRSGEEIYVSTCSSCHGTGILNAPKSGNQADWAPRLKRGLEDLVEIAITGVGAMPPRGTCMDCSDDEIRAAIKHMVE